MNKQIGIIVAKKGNKLTNLSCCLDANYFNGICNNQDRTGVISFDTEIYRFMREGGQITDVARCIQARYNKGYSTHKAEMSGVMVDNVRIRKLTPKECFRLQGWCVLNDDGTWDDSAFEKAKNAGVSDSQLYKQAGNGCSANITYAIGLALKERNE